MIDEKLLALLACPACQGDIELSKNQKDEKLSFLICVRCRHTYPIVDGIPVLLVDPSQK